MPVTNRMLPVHPGEVLREEMDERDLSASALARALEIPANRITAILNGQRGVTAATAHRLSRYFGTTAELWLNLQKTWELRRAEIEVEEGGPVTFRPMRGEPCRRSGQKQAGPDHGGVERLASGDQWLRDAGHGAARAA